MAKIIVDELITYIALKTTKDSKRAVQNAENAIKNIRRFAFVATGALAGLAYAMDKIIAGVDKQAKFATGLGMTYENLQKIQFAGQKAGASIEDIDSALETLTKTMTSTKPGEYNSALLQMGVSARDLTGKMKPASQVLLEISDRFKEMNAIRRQQFGSRLGFSSSTVNFLAQGSSQIVKDMQEAERIGGVIPERLKGIAAAFYDDSLLRVKTTLKGIASVVALSLAPALSKVLNQFDEWIIANKDLIATNLGNVLRGIGEGLSNFGKIMGYVLTSIAKFTEKLFGAGKGLTTIKVASILTTSALLALAAVIVSASAPFTAFGVAIAGIIAILPSFIDYLEKTYSLAKELFPGVFGRAAEFVDNLSSSIRQLKDDFSELFNLFNLGLGSFGGLSNIAQSSLDELNLVKQGTSGNFATLSKMYAANGGANNNAYNSSSSSNVTNNVNITVSGSGNPSAVAAEVKRKFDVSTAQQVSQPGFNRPKVA